MIRHLESWIQKGKKMGATHIILVCDTFSYDDYPVYVMPDEKVEEKKKKYDGINMQRLNGVVTL